MELIRGLRTSGASAGSGTGEGSAERREVLRMPIDLSPAGGEGESLLAAVLAAVLGRFLSYDEVVLGIEAAEGGTFVELPVGVATSRTVGEVIREIDAGLAGVEGGPPAAEASAPSVGQLLVHAVLCAPDLIEAETAGPWTLLPKGTEFDLGNADCAFAWSGPGESSELLLSFDSSRLEPERMEVLLASAVEAANHAAQARAHAEDPAISQLPLLPDSMRRKIIEEFNETWAPLSDTDTTVDLIERQIRARPDSIALVYEEHSLTYAELGERARRLAAVLRERGVRKGDLVGLLVGNSLEYPTTILACMLLGAVFIPMDEMWPAERLESLLRDTDPKAILVKDAEAPEGFRDRVVRCEEWRGAAPADVGEEILQTDLFYGLPTSGSTGPPKCSLNLHRGLLNRFQYMTRRYKSDSSEVVLQNSRPAFDSSLWQLLWPLTNGATVVIPRPTKDLNLSNTIALIHRHQVTMTDFVPSVFNTLVRHLEQEPADVARLSSLRNLLIGGEEINKEYCRRFHDLLPHVGLTNTYGPTEASIGMVFYEVDVEEDEIPIGRPIDNTFAVVLDEEMRLVPPGVVGELYIGGVCLGAGYLRDPERTAAAWVPNPFEELDGDSVYRTGDLVYQVPDGRLYFLGRSDGQVKIAGIRIELAEIEHMLTRHPAIDRAVVLTEETGAGDRLVAYVVAKGGQPKPAQLKEHLQDLLPKQAVPGRFVYLDDLPINHNGKLDRKKLRLAASKTAEPLGETPQEIGLFEVWRDLLGTDDFGLDDDFFLLGGDSLLVTHLVYDIAERFDVRVPLRTVYDAPTIRQLAAIVSGDVPVAEEPSREEELELARADCPLLDELPAAPADRRPGAGPRTVLMTGATGFVGVHLVERLLARTEAEVLFLARDGDDAVASERLREAMRSFGLWEDGFEERLRPVCGGLEAEALGLSQQEWVELADRAEAIVNCGGMVDFLHDYRRHRPANVEGVERIARLAGEGGAALHHISSISARHTDPPPVDGYGLSKWVAEHLVARATERGYDVTAHRLGEVMPHSRTGVPNTRSLSYMLVRSCLILGLYPEDLVSLDYSPADWVADAIVDSVLAERSSGPRDIWHPTGVTLDEIMERASQEGAFVQPVGGEEFRRGLEARCELEGDRTLHSLRAFFTGALQEQDDRDDIDGMLSGLFISLEDGAGGHLGVSIGNPATDWPEIDADVLAPMLARAAPRSRSRAYSS